MKLPFRFDRGRAYSKFASRSDRGRVGLARGSVERGGDSCILQLLKGVHSHMLISNSQPGSVRVRVTTLPPSTLLFVTLRFPPSKFNIRVMEVSEAGREHLWSIFHL